MHMHTHTHTHTLYRILLSKTNQITHAAIASHRPPRSDTGLFALPSGPGAPGSSHRAGGGVSSSSPSLHSASVIGLQSAHAHPQTLAHGSGGFASQQRESVGTRTQSMAGSQNGRANVGLTSQGDESSVSVARMAADMRALRVTITEAFEVGWMVVLTHYEMRDFVSMLLFISSPVHHSLTPHILSHPLCTHAHFLSLSLFLSFFPLN